MADVTVNGFGGLSDHLAKVAKALDPRMGKVMLNAADEARAEIEATLRNEASKSGDLSRSFAVSFLEQERDRITTAALSNSVYAGVRDRPETTIVPRIRKYLAIPLQQMPAGTSPREFIGRKDFVLLRSKKGNLIQALITGKGKNQRIKPMFALKKQVTQHGIEYIRRTWESKQDSILGVIADGAEEIVRNG